MRGLHDTGKYPNKAHNWRIRSYFAVGSIIVHCAVMDVNTDVFMASVEVDALRVGAVEVVEGSENEKLKNLGEK